MFKFKFYIILGPKLDSFKIFLDNWKGRHPLFIQVSGSIAKYTKYTENFFDLIKEYKEKGTVKSHDWIRNHDLEWN